MQNFPEKHLANHGLGAYAVRMKNGIKITYEDILATEIELENKTTLWFRKDLSKIFVTRNGEIAQRIQLEELSIEEQKAIEIFLSI